MDGDARAPKKIKGAVKPETAATTAKAGDQPSPARFPGENPVGKAAFKKEQDARSSAKRPKGANRVDRAVSDVWEPHRAAHNVEYRATAISVGAALPKGTTAQSRRQPE